MASALVLELMDLDHSPVFGKRSRNTSKPVTWSGHKVQVGDDVLVYANVESKRGGTGGKESQECRPKDDSVAAMAWRLYESRDATSMSPTRKRGRRVAPTTMSLNWMMCWRSSS